jgi:hypothetical protein
VLLAVEEALALLVLDHLLQLAVLVRHLLLQVRL